MNKTTMRQIFKKIWISILCFVFLISGCAKVDQSTSNPLNQEKSSAVVTDEDMPSEGNKEKYEADYEYLWDILENKYPYLNYIDENIVKTQDLHDRYGMELENVNDDAGFMDLIHRMLGEMEYFAHLDVITPNVYKNLYSILLLDENVYSMMYGDADKDGHILNNPKLSEIYDKPSHYEEYQEEENSNALNEIDIRYYSDCKALYMRISSFEHALVERDQNIVYDTITQYPDTEHIIFDIAANHGGDNTYWMDNIVAPFGGHYDFRYRIFYKSSEFSDMPLLATSELEDRPEWVDTLGLNLYCENDWAIPEEKDDKKLIKGNIKRWILVGENTYSAAERFSCFCKYSGWATLVGTRTGGDGLGSVVFDMLPDSGIMIQFNCAVGENPDGTINAVVGTSPDVNCNEKGHIVSPLERCLELIREGQ